MYCIVYVSIVYVYVRGQLIINSRANQMTLKADALQKYSKTAVAEIICMYVCVFVTLSFIKKVYI